MKEGALSRSQIAEARGLSFEFALIDYYEETTRGLYGRTEPKEKKKIDGYVEMFEETMGINLAHEIERKTLEASEINILDLGCGSGQFLIDCRRKWGDWVRCFGVNAAGLRDLSDPHKMDSNVDELLYHDIKYQIGDIQNLDNYYEQNQFDVVTGVMVTHYTADPLAVLEQTYELLKPGGMGFLLSIPFRFEDEDEANLLRAHLKGKGMYLVESERAVIWPEFHIIFTKSKEPLDLPVAHAGFDFTQPWYNPYLTYQLA